MTSDPPADEAEEQVAVIDETGAVIGSVPRSVMRRDNLPHLVAAVLVRDPAERVYVHRRAETKDVFPGMHDAFAAGCVQAGEHPDDTARREVAEELGVSGVPVQRLLQMRYDDAETRHVCHVYGATWSGPVTHQPEEVVWGAWLTTGELRARLADPGWPFVPDGRALLARLFADGTLR